MASPDAIKYELGLTIVVALGFWFWQTLDLRRAARELKERDEAEKRSADPGPPADDTP